MSRALCVFSMPVSVAQKNKLSTMLSPKVQSIDLPMDCTAWRFRMTRRLNGCSTPAPRSKNWLRRRRGMLAQWHLHEHCHYFANHFVVCLCSRASLLLFVVSWRQKLFARRFTSRLLFFCAQYRVGISSVVKCPPPSWKVRCSIHIHWVNCRRAPWARTFPSTAPARSTIQAKACRQLPTQKKIELMI